MWTGIYYWPFATLPHNSISVKQKNQFLITWADQQVGMFAWFKNRRGENLKVYKLKLDSSNICLYKLKLEHFKYLLKLEVLNTVLSIL